MLPDARCAGHRTPAHAGQLDGCRQSGRRGGAIHRQGAFARSRSRWDSTSMPTSGAWPQSSDLWVAAPPSVSTPTRTSPSNRAAACRRPRTDRDIELFEQPCDKAALGGQCRRRRGFDRTGDARRDRSTAFPRLNVPPRSRAWSFVKVKLKKLGSLARLEAALKRIAALGLVPVLGRRHGDRHFLLDGGRYRAHDDLHCR